MANNVDYINTTNTNVVASLEQQRLSILDSGKTATTVALKIQNIFTQLEHAADYFAARQAQFSQQGITLPGSQEKRQARTFEEQQSRLQTASSGDEAPVIYDTLVSVGTPGEQQAILDALLTEIETYEQQRQKVIETYAAKRKLLYKEDNTTLKTGVTQGNVDELALQEEEATKAIDEQFATREATYQVWLESIADLSLETLKTALVEAQTELATAQEPDAKGGNIAVARAKVGKIQGAIDKAQAEHEAAPGKKTLDKWKKLGTTLDSVSTSFDDMGTAVGGTAGDSLKAVGKIAKSTSGIIDGITKLVGSSAEAMKASTTSAVTTMSTLEKASVIIAIIGAAMQVAMAIASLFNDDKEHQEKIERLQGKIDKLQWELDNVEVGRLKKNDISILETVRNVYAQTRTEVLSLMAVEGQYNASKGRFWSGMLSKNKVLMASSAKLAEAYTKIDYTKTKALGSAKYTEAQESLKNMAQQQLLIQQQIEEEKQKKDVDTGQIAEWEQAIQALGVEAIETINTLVEDIMGGSSSEIANELGGAFIKAFRDGEDAAQAWGLAVNDIVAGIMQRMLIEKYLEVPLGEVFDTYKSKWFGSGAFSIDAVINSMGDFTSDLLEKGEVFKAVWDKIPDNLKELFMPADEKREGSARGIATASQDSVDENNGLLTSIQGHTFLLCEKMTLLQPDVARIAQLMGYVMDSAARQLEVMLGIEINTRNLIRLERIEGDMGAVKNTLNDIALKGITIK